MEKIAIEDFETRLVLRTLEATDYEAVASLQQVCFPGMASWTAAQFRNHVETFPEGQIGIEIDGALVATASSLVVDYADYTDWHDFDVISDHGTIANHDPEGDTLYGIEMQVHPDFRSMKLARRLYDARKQLCRRLGLARIMVGGRIPGYAAHREDLTVHAYIEAVMAKRLYDPVLTAQLANGFVLKAIIDDYLPSDVDSAGYATHLEWVNLDYRPVKGRHQQTIQRVRVAVVQFMMRRIGSFEEFATQCEFFVDTASDYRSDFVVFPELFTLQLLSLVDANRPGTAARELANLTPDYLRVMADLAVRYNINIIGGSQFILEDQTLYNVAHLFRRDGSIDRQYKLHVTPNEARWWGVRGGHGLHVFPTDRGPIGILICYDVQFPELARYLAAKGARIIFVPYNTHDRYGHQRVQLCAQARCIENHVYTVTAGCVGNLPFVDNADIHYAQSGVYTPSDVAFARDGIAAQATANVETVLVHELDTQALRRHRRQGTVHNWHDRRRDLYGVAWHADEASEEV